MFWQRDKQQEISRAIEFIAAVTDGYKFCVLASKGGWGTKEKYQSFKASDLPSIAAWLSTQQETERRVMLNIHKMKLYTDYCAPTSMSYDGTRWVTCLFHSRTPAEIHEMFSPAPTVILSTKNGNYVGYAVERAFTAKQHAQVIKARAAYVRNEAVHGDWLPTPFFGASMVSPWDADFHDQSAFPSTKEDRPVEHAALSMYAPVVRSAPAQVEQYQRAPQFDVGGMGYEAPRSARSGAPSGNAVMLGNGERGAIHWAPFETEDRLLNFGVLVTGDPGAGKTQTLNVLINGVAKMALPICIFDFKNDYSDPAFAQTNKLKVHDVRRRGIPFNPLVPSAAPGQQVQPIEHIFTVTSVLQRVFRIGDRQAATLRDAMKEAFERRGINPQKWVDAESINPPGFNEVVGILKGDSSKEAVALLDRISPLFDLGLFPKASKAASSFEAMIDNRVVLSLYALPTDEIKAAIAELIIIRLHGVLLKRPQPRKLSRLLVIDEAWRIASSKHLENLAREGRAFGAGIAIGTQYPGDLPADFSGALDTKIFLSNKQPDHRRAVIKALCGGQAAPEAGNLQSTLERLKQFEGLIQNSQYQPYAKFKLTPYFARQDHGNVPDLHTGYDPAAMHLDADEDQNGDCDYRPTPTRKQPRQSQASQSDRQRQVQEWVHNQLIAAGGSIELSELRKAGEKLNIWPAMLYQARDAMGLLESDVQGGLNNGKVWSFN